MFIGEYSHNVDDKGRLAIPAKFRSELAKGAVVTKGLDGCLFLYTIEEWQKIAQKLASLSFSKSNNRAFTRLMLAGAMDVEIDKQGRIVIPEYLRKFASLNKKVTVTGLFNRIELWDESVWNEYKLAKEPECNEIAEELVEIENL